MCDYTGAHKACQRHISNSITHSKLYVRLPLPGDYWFRIGSLRCASWEGRPEKAMKSVFYKSIVTITLICSMLLVSESAWALRCGNRLVKEGMLESQVIAICGDPVETRQLGYVLRPYVVTQPAGMNGMHATRHVYSGFHQELSVTQMVFNFGPHKLMRILRFEGGQLTSITTAGYGYHERP